MKFNFRKITSALASTAMLGLTVATAAAANFPAPFVQNGNADVAIVYGSNLDLPAVTDISTALSSALSGSSSGAPASDDAYPLFTSSTPLQLNNSLNSVRTTVTEGSLPTVLGDTDFSGNVDAEVSFQLTLGQNPRIIFAEEPTTSSEPAVGLFYGTAASQYLYNATVSFDEAVDFTNTESEGESVTLFGQDFTVSSATDSDTLVLFKSAETLFLSVGSASSVPSQTVEVEGETYTIELVAASDDSATIKVTNSAGQSDQKEIDEAASKKILGVEVAVNTADESTATNVIQAEILVGANRLTFEDGSEVKVGTDNTAVDGTMVDLFGNANATTKLTIQVFAERSSEDFLQAGDEFVDPVFGSFRLAFNGLAVDLEDTESREEIIIASSGQDSASLTFTSWQGETLSSFEWLNNKTGGPTGVFLGDDNDVPLIVRELAPINDSGFAIIGNEDEGVLLELTTLDNSSSGYNDDDVIFTNVMTQDTYSADISSEGVGTINIEGSSYGLTYMDLPSIDSDEHVRLNFPDSTSAGNLVVFPAIETSQGANLALYEPITIDFGNVDGAGQDVTQLKFPDGDGYTDVTVTYGVNPSVWNVTAGSTTTAVNLTLLNGAAFTVGTLTYSINASSAQTAGNNLSVVRLHEGGSAITRPAVVLFEEQDEADVYNTVIFETSGAGVSDNGVSISESTFSWNSDADMEGTAYGSGFESEAAEDVYLKLDQWGTLVTSDQTDSDQHSITVSYPDEQAVAMIYIDALVEGSGSGTLGDVKVMDDELASSGMSSKNLIVVGGSCVNTAASTLLGNAGCGASWTAASGAGSGEWIIQTFANPWANSKVATLVAGWEQGDTANAATYLTTQEPEVTVGEGMTGTTSTSAVPMVI